MTLYDVTTDDVRLVDLNDTETYVATWGARLIFDEVKHGQPGRLPIVGDRQTARESDARDLDRIDRDLLGSIGDTMRALIRAYRLTSDSNTVFVFRPEPDILVTFSANGSYGYIYLRVGIEAVASGELSDEYPTLGPCGCVDYHMADCPTRDRDEGQGWGEDASDYDDWESEDEPCDDFDPDDRWPNECLTCGYEKEEH